MKPSAKKKTGPKPAIKTAAKPASRGLGKGLSALMSDSYSQVAPGTDSETQAEGAPHSLELSLIRSGKYQPRGYFDQPALEELASSIRENGVMQPILVRPVEGGQYEIIAGERRWRASKMAGLSEIPVLIREINNEQALELALVENVQRKDLHPLEEGAGYQRLMDEFGYTQEELSATVHKSRSYIASLLRILTLPREVRLLLADDKITMGHARALMAIPGEQAKELAEEIARRGLNVRQTEKLIRNNRHLTIERKPRQSRADKIAEANARVVQIPTGIKDPDIMALEETLSENLGLKVSITDRGQSGEIMIAYESLEQLDEILRRLGGSI